MEEGAQDGEYERHAHAPDAPGSGVRTSPTPPGIYVETIDEPSPGVQTPLPQLQIYIYIYTDASGHGVQASSTAPDICISTQMHQSLAYRYLPHILHA